MYPSSPSAVNLDLLQFDEHEVRELHVRVSAEFREMPGLTLTLAQAARLFSLDPARCEYVLAGLVEHGILAASARGFARADAGRRYA